MHRLVRAPRLSAALLASSIALALGCGKDATSPQAQLAGTYTLRTVNGTALPIAYQVDATTTLTLLADTLTFSSNGALSQQTGVRITQGTATSTENVPDTGTWTLNGTSITVKYASDGSTESGTFTGGNTITLKTPSGATTRVYQK